MLVQKCQTTEISTNGPNKSLNKKSNNGMDPAKPQQSIYPPENLEVSGNSSACPTKMGEGENWPSHCPLPKVVVRSEEVPLKSPTNNNPTTRNLRSGTKRVV